MGAGRPGWSQGAAPPAPAVHAPSTAPLLSIRRLKERMVGGRFPAPTVDLVGAGAVCGLRLRLNPPGAAAPTSQGPPERGWHCGAVWDVGSQSLPPPLQGDRVKSKSEPLSPPFRVQVGKLRPAERQVPGQVHCQREQGEELEGTPPPVRESQPLGVSQVLAGQDHQGLVCSDLW